MKATLSNAGKGVLGSLGAYPARELLRPLIFLQGWQFAEKASRLLVVVVLARRLDAVELGIVALALSIGDLLKSLTQNGAAQRVIAASDCKLEAVSRGAYLFQRRWMAGVAAIQIACAAVLYDQFERPLIALMVLLLALEYLALPRISISLGRALRCKSTRERVAHVAGSQNVLGNIVTLIILLVWPHPVVMVLARLLVVPIYLIGILKLAPWRPNAGRRVSSRSIRRYAGAVTLSEIAKASRMHIDKILIGAMLGMAATGEYFFAFSAGLGLANSLAVALGTALFPFLTSARDRTHALFYALQLTMFCIVPIVLLQMVLAPIYVPLLFSEKWAHLSDIVSILCLAAIPGTLWSAVAQYLRSIDKAPVETGVTIGQTLTIAGATYFLAPHGLHALAVGYVTVISLTTAMVAGPLLWQLKKKLKGRQA